MKRHFLILLTLFVTVPSLQAQWITKTTTLVPGWNSMWLSGDATYSTVASLFSSYPTVTEVWRWNPNPDQIQFSEDPSSPTTSSDEWTVWKRNDTTEQLLTQMVPNSAYLLNVSANTTVSIKQLVTPPSATWLISGANFIGFPSAGSGTSAPLMSNYFASFISGNTSTSGLPASTKIYKYVGGTLGTNNPLQLLAGSERMAAGQAYWFSLPVVTNFTGPLEYEPPGTNGLAFGRTVSTMSVGVTNRTTSALTLTLMLESSDSAPSGQPGITGGVPLTRRVFNSTTNSYDETAISGSFTVSVPASGRLSLDFGINRTAMTGSSSLYASILRITDSAGLTDVRLPVSAQPATTAGLWVAKINVTNVESTAANSGSTTTQPFSFLVLAHVDSTGAARLLRQVFVGQLTTATNPLGLALREDKVLSYAAASIKPHRYYVPMMPASLPTVTGTGTFATGSAMTWLITHAHNDPTNPFVHTYHPDHDNKDARFTTALSAGVESYTVGRTIGFNFTQAPPGGSTVSGWGTTVLGGIYTETLTGLNKDALNISGNFAMRRISEIADIDLTAP